MPQHDDHELLLLTHRGRSTAAGILWSRYAPLIRAYARAVLGKQEASAACDDVVQVVFCRILELPEATLAQVRDVSAWLLSLARHAALDHLRATRREHARRGAARAVRAPAAGDADIKRAVEALPRRLREVLVLRHVAGLSFDQLALALGIPRSTASSRYALAVRFLESSLRADPTPSLSEVHHA